MRTPTRLLATAAIALAVPLLATCTKSSSTTSGSSGAPDASQLSPSRATERAPAVFKARFTTTKGDFVVEAHRDWAPNGVDRFYNLVKLGYFTNVGIFRVIDGFMMQFGISGDPAVNAAWRTATIPDDPPVVSNQRGMVTFAKGGPNSRTTQLFVNFADNSRLDGMGFPAIGQVTEGMDVVDSIYKVGEGAPGGPGPSQGRLQMEGNAYLQREYPKLDYIKSAKIE